MSLIICQSAFAQTPTSPSTLSSAPVVTAGFSEPDKPRDWRLYQAPDACISLFERILRQTTFNTQPEKNVAHDTQPMKEDDWTPLPSASVTAGQQCVDHLHVADIPAFELPNLLRLAIAINNDSLVQAVVARQVALAGSSERSHAHVLESVVHSLTTNGWADFDHTVNHLTEAHIALARTYAMQIDSMDGPTTLLYRLRALDDLSASLRIGDSDVTARLAYAEDELQRMQRVPLNAVPASDRKEIFAKILGEELHIKRLAYIQSLSHEDLTQWHVMWDSVHRVIKSPIWDSLTGQPAAPITCDYAFNAPGSAPGASIPTSGIVSLLVFVNPNKIDQIDYRRFAELRRQQQLFPTLKITLIAMTSGTFQGRDLLPHPEQEATFIHQYLTDSLGLPGTVCVVKSQYRTVAGGRAIPLLTPVLEGYKLDPRTYGREEFLVDPLGWIVGGGSVADEELIRRLLLQTTVP
jgi:hypothetical protein